MQRFKNILVVVDELNISSDNPAVQRGAELARQNDAALTLLHVFDEPQASIKQYQDFVSADELSSLLTQNKSVALEKLVIPLRSSLFQVGSRVVIGRGFIEIISQVLRNDFDIVIKVAQTQGNHLDSNDIHLMRKCPCPVWLIRKENKSNAVLAAIDLRLEESIAGQQMNRLIMDLASSLVKWDKAKLHMICCWTLFGEDALRNSGFLKISSEKLTAMLDAERVEYQARQKNLAMAYNIDEQQLVLIKGKPDYIIPEFVHDKHINTVVMGTVGRTGIPGLIIGNTAETVLHSIDTSIIAVKPSDFISPVSGESGNRP
jgi:universal stress protein E